MPWNYNNKWKQEVEMAFNLLDSFLEDIDRVETPEETKRLDAVSMILANTQDLRQVPLQKLRKAMGLPRPATKKARNKAFKHLRETVNFTNNKIIITKAGYMKGIQFQNDDGTFPNLRQRKELVLRSAARFLGEELAKKKQRESAPPVDEGAEMHIPEPGTVA